MGRKEEIKQKLSSFNLKSLCLNDDDFYFKSIAEKTKTTGRAIGVIIQGFDEKKPDGIAITEDGIEWHASMLSSLVSINGKKTAKPGKISYKDLAHYKCSYEEGGLSKGGGGVLETLQGLVDEIELNRNDLTDTNLKIAFSFDLSKFDTPDKETAQEQILKLFELLTQVETVDGIIPDEKRLDYLEAFIPEEDTNPVMRLIQNWINVDTGFSAYKHYFAKYAKKSSWAFSYKNDLLTIVASIFTLLYRKVYIAGSVFVALIIIVSSVIPGIGGTLVALLIMAIQSMINPYIIYRHYVGVLKKCSSSKMTEEQTIETLRKKGGSNGYLALIAAVLLIIFTFDGLVQTIWNAL